MNPNCILLNVHGFCFLSLLSTETRRKASAWQRNLGYPLVMLLLLALTVRMSILPFTLFVMVSHAVMMLRLVDLVSQVVCVLMVCFHVLELLFDESAMPRGMEVRFI